MDATMVQTAKTCLEGAETSSIISTDRRYLIRKALRLLPMDFRRASATIFILPDGDSLVAFPAHHGNAPIADKLDTSAVQAAIREA